MKLKEQIIGLLHKKKESKIGFWLAVILAVVTVLASILYFIIFPDNLMHSDMAAEVLLSKLLAEEGGLISKNWFYSTEIRIVYTQLVMTPLFLFIKDFGVVKLISVIFYDVLLMIVFYFTAKRASRKYLFSASRGIQFCFIITTLKIRYHPRICCWNIIYSFNNSSTSTTRTSCLMV